MEEWRSGRVEKWKSGRVEKWRSGRVERWKGGGVISNYFGEQADADSPQGDTDGIF